MEVKIGDTTTQGHIIWIEIDQSDLVLPICGVIVRDRILAIAATKYIGVIAGATV